MQDRFSNIAVFVLSVAIHAGLLWWWVHRPAASPVALGVAPSIAVDLLAAPEVSEPEPVEPERPQPEEADEPAPVPKPVKPKKPQPKQPPKPTTPSPEPTKPVMAQAPEPTTAPVEGPPSTAARYDAAYLNNPAPLYPPLSRRLGEEGTVLLRVAVSVEGRATSVGVEKTSGSARLDKAALAAVTHWRFVPAQKNGVAEASQVDVPIRFSLKHQQ